MTNSNSKLVNLAMECGVLCGEVEALILRKKKLRYRLRLAIAKAKVRHLLNYKTKKMSLSAFLRMRSAIWWDPKMIALLEIDPAGWVRIELVCKYCTLNMTDKNPSLPTPEDVIREIVRDSQVSKGRFGIKVVDGRTYVRAHQGHLDHPLLDRSMVTPTTLEVDIYDEESRYGYHVAPRTILGILLGDGLKAMGRTFVHAASSENRHLLLEINEEMVILRIDLWGMTLAGNAVRVADNGVLQMETVPPQFLSVVDTLPPVV